MPGQFSTIDDAAAALARGEVIVVVDAEDREDEGDFVCAADRVTPELVNFMIRGGGLLCMPLLPDVCERLKLNPVVESNTAPLGTPFTVQVDHRSCKTGITAAERARTIQAIIDPDSKPSDFVRPGHVFPLIAKEGGVLRRAGHTEATVDLCRIAGLTPAGVLCEVLNEQGDRADRDQLFEIARKHGLQICSIEDLIRYRRRSEKLVYRHAETILPTKRYGPLRAIAYGVKYESSEPIVLVKGDPTSVEAPLVRLHSSCFTGDLLESLRCDCGDQLHMALEMIAREGTGVLVYLIQEGRGIGLVEKLKAYSLQDKGLDTVEANVALGFKADVRDYGIGIQLLKDLGLTNVRLLTNNPKKTDAFIYGGFDLHVVDQVPIAPTPNEHNLRYLATKREKLGHRLPEAPLVQPANGSANPNGDPAKLPSAGQDLS
jgi:3,4-dihydroxy 2-butanone 4-phosphate synthase/GTP cyclohydrolase II